MIKLQSHSEIFTSVPKFLFSFPRMWFCQKLWLRLCAETAHLPEIIGQSHILCLQLSYPTCAARLLNSSRQELEGEELLMNNYSRLFKSIKLFTLIICITLTHKSKCCCQKQLKYQLKAKLEWQTNMETTPATRTNTHKHEISFQYQVL